MTFKLKVLLLSEAIKNKNTTLRTIYTKFLLRSSPWIASMKFIVWITFPKFIYWKLEREYHIHCCRLSGWVSKFEGNMFASETALLYYQYHPRRKPQVLLIKSWARGREREREEFGRCPDTRTVDFPATTWGWLKTWNKNSNLVRDRRISCN